MADLSRHLPLSHRSAVDESGVTTDRRADIALVRERQADLIARGNPARADLLRAEATRVVAHSTSTESRRRGFHATG